MCPPVCSVSCPTCLIRVYCPTCMICVLSHFSNSVLSRLYDLCIAPPVWSAYCPTWIQCLVPSVWSVYCPPPVWSVYCPTRMICVLSYPNDCVLSHLFDLCIDPPYDMCIVTTVRSCTFKPTWQVYCTTVMIFVLSHLYYLCTASCTFGICLLPSLYMICLLFHLHDLCTGPPVCSVYCKGGHLQFKSAPPQLRNIADYQIDCGVAD